MSKRKTYDVWHITGSSEDPEEMHFSIKGPLADSSFANGLALAAFIETVLNAANKLPVPKT